MQIYIVFGLIIIAVILFSFERFRIDVITISLLICLMVTGILTPTEAFSGYASEFIVILISIFLISGALRQTGILDLIASRLLRMAKLNPGFLLMYIMSLVGMTSAFMNNTTVTAMFITPVMSVGRHMKINSSKLLMPVAYASLLGGTCTLIGTSTNIAVSGYMKQNGIAPVGMFEILPIGLILFVTGIIYMLTIGKNLLPDQKDESLADDFNLRAYISEAEIPAGSKLIGQNIFHSNLSQMGFRILNIIRNDLNFQPDRSSIIEAGDILIIEGKIEDLILIRETAGIEIRADAHIDKALQGDNIKLAEVLVLPQSDFANKTLKEFNFKKKYELVVIAIYRSGQFIAQKIGSTVLRVGDILLVQGALHRIDYHKTNREISVVADFKPFTFRKRKGRLTLLFFLLAIITGSTGILPLTTALIVATLLIFLIKAINIETAFKAIEWRLLIMIGGMSAFGLAMTKTGGANYLANEIISVCSPYGVLAILTGFIVLTVILTQPMSNAAAALVVLPVAIETANLLNVNPRSFAIAVMLSASVSLIAPFEPSCILVYGPGKYKFFDFVKTGSLLTAIMILILVWLVPYFWPLNF
jgi:di/tricarboxylate transporter